MFRFFKHRLPARKFKNSSSTETPVGPGHPSRAWVRTDYNLASVSSKGRKFGVRPVLGKRRTDWTLGNTGILCGNISSSSRTPLTVGTWVPELCFLAVRDQGFNTGSGVHSPSPFFSRSAACLDVLPHGTAI